MSEGSPDAAPGRPLQGLLVADFSRVLAGPMATMTLADLGATVVKVERPRTGDDTRQWGPPFTERSSVYFECANRGKASIVLDLRDDGDRALAVELARRADVLVENFRPGGLVQYGLDFEAVRHANPGIVYCSISGFGPGPGQDLPGYDFIVQAVGGLMEITGLEDGGPTKVGVALVDVLAGKDAVIGIQAALAARARTGIGQLVEVNLLSSLLAGLVNQVGNALAGHEPERLGNRHPSIAPYETLRCADGEVAVACGNDDQFRRLLGALGCDRVGSDGRFATNRDRVANRRQLVAVLEGVLTGGTVAHWVALLQRSGVPCGAVGGVSAGVALARDLGLDPVRSVGDGYLPQVRHPVTYSACDAGTSLPPPDLGAHSDAVRAWLRRAGELADLSSQISSGPARLDDRKAPPHDDDQKRPEVPDG